MEKKIEDVLVEIGVPAGISGFDFIKEAVLILDRDKKIIKWTEAYAEIGNKYGKTASQVERSIRHALGVARSAKGDFDEVNRYIGFVNTNNSSSISLLYRTIKREMEEEQVDSKIKFADKRPVISEEQVKEIVRETIKEILGGTS